MKLKVSDLKNALLGIESNRQLSSDIVEGALVEALSKAYRKHVNIPDGYVHVAIENGHIHIYPQRMVVEEVEDDALEFSLEDAQKYKKDASRERKRLFYSIISTVDYSSTIATRLNLASS